MDSRDFIPTVETVGYFRRSLRDPKNMRARLLSSNDPFNSVKSFTFNTAPDRSPGQAKRRPGEYPGNGEPQRGSRFKHATDISLAPPAVRRIPSCLCNLFKVGGSRALAPRAALRLPWAMICNRVAVEAIRSNRYFEQLLGARKRSPQRFKNANQDLLANAAMRKEKKVSRDSWVSLRARAVRYKRSTSTMI